MSKKLIKIDRNGTKYYEETVKCPRCGGHGIYAVGVLNGELVPARPDAGVCYQCHGSGWVLDITKEYTPEHQAKLDKNREAREQKKFEKAQAELEQKKAEYRANGGFDENGDIWLVLGNTYPIKDELKSKGAKFKNWCGGVWTFNHEEPNYPMYKLNIDNVIGKYEVGAYVGMYNGWVNDKAEDEFNKANNEFKIANNPNKNSEHLGAVGDKVELDVTVARVNSYDTQFGTTHIYTFNDANNNVIVWKTSTYMDKLDDKGDFVKCAEVGDKMHIKGTIKALDEYKGVKQTQLTRCKYTYL